MAQVKFGVCVDEFAPKPTLVPRFLGSFTARDAPVCFLGGEEKRRKDVLPSQYGKGTPTISSISYDPWGVPETYTGKHEMVPTEEGSIKLTVDSVESYDPIFQPTVSLLNLLPFTDSRMRSLSDRYYRH